MKRLVFIFSIAFITTIAQANDYCFSNNPDRPILVEMENEPPKTHIENKLVFVFASKAAQITREGIISEKPQIISKSTVNTLHETGFSIIISGFKTGLSIWDSAENKNISKVRTFSDHANQFRLSVGKTIHGVGLKLKF